MASQSNTPDDSDYSTVTKRQHRLICLKLNFLATAALLCHLDCQWDFMPGHLQQRHVKHRELTPYSTIIIDL